MEWRCRRLDYCHHRYVFHLFDAGLIEALRKGSEQLPAQTHLSLQTLIFERELWRFPVAPIPLEEALQLVLCLPKLEACGVQPALEKRALLLCLRLPPPHVEVV